MTDRRARLLLGRLRNVLWKCALRKWSKEGWTIKPHMECRDARHKQAKDGKPVRLAELDEENCICHLWTHPAEIKQPVAKTLLHEMVGHILLDLQSVKSEEKDVEEIEDILWECLTPAQHQALKNLLIGLTETS